jgi:hypothetical protein
METFRTAVVPVASAFVLLAGIVLYAAKHPEAGVVSRHPVDWRPRLILIGWTAIGGYVVFLAIVLVFHVWIVGQRGLMRSATINGGFLAAAFSAASVLLSAFERRCKRPALDSSPNHRARLDRRPEAGR